MIVTCPECGNEQGEVNLLISWWTVVCNLCNSIFAVESPNG